MKSLRVSITAFILCFSVVMSMTICTEARAITRIGVLFINLLDEDVKIQPASKAYQKIQNRYAELLMDALQKTGNFDVVKLSNMEYASLITGPMISSQKKNSTSEKNGIYRPYYSPSMARAREQQAGMEELQNKALSELAKKYNCNYIVNTTLQIDASNANVQLIVYDVNEIGIMPNFFSSGEGSIRNEVSDGKKTSKKSSSKAKSSQTFKEQAVIAAFSEAIRDMQDKLTGIATKIVKIDGNNIILNKGASSVKVGNFYMVKAELNDELNNIYSAGKQSSTIIPIAIIEVKDIQENSSIAEIIADGGNINAIRIEEDMVEPITKNNVTAYLSQISDGKVQPFPAQHPGFKKAESASSATAVQKKTQKPSQPKKGKNTVATEELPALPPGVIRVGVINFDSKTEGISQAEASTLTDLLSRILSNSDKIAVLERDKLEAIAGEHELNISGIIDPATAAQIGKLASCQYILTGSVTDVEQSDTISGRYIRPTESANYSQILNPRNRPLSRTGAGILLGLELLDMAIQADNAQKENVVTETYEIITNVDVRLINVQTSQIAMAFTEQGSAAESNTVTQDGNGNLKGMSINAGSIENRSIASTAANIGNRVREFLADEKLQISSVNGDEIIINRGSSSGIQIDDLFCVYNDGQTGGDTEAIISVKDVQDLFSTAELAQSISDSYSVAQGGRLESVLHSDYQKGIWHIKNKRRQQASEAAKNSISLEELANNAGRKKRFETSATDIKKVIKSYGLPTSHEKALIDAHSKASKESSAKKKYEAYKQLSNTNLDDFLAAYNAGKYALEQSMYVEAREWASKALFVNPNYKPAKALIEKIDSGN